MERLGIGLLLRTLCGDQGHPDLVAVCKVFTFGFPPSSVFLALFPLSIFFSFLFKQPKCARGFLELAVNRSLGKAKLVLIFNCSVFLCFNRSLKTCFKKQKEKKHAKGNSVQGLKTLLGESRRIPRVHRVLRDPIVE